LKIWEFFASALDTLWANKMRSALTMIGIVIGTAAVISIFALGQSAANSIAASLGTFGDQGIFFFPDAGSRRIRAAQIQWRDVAILRDGCSRCFRVFPIYDQYFSVRLGHTKEVVELASDTDYVVDKLPMAEGQRFTADDVAAAKPICNILWVTKKKFFGDGSALGKYIRVAGRRFLVTGVYADVSLGIFNGVAGGDNTVFIPYTTFHHLPTANILGLQVFRSADSSAAQTIDEVQAQLARIHGPRAKYEAQDFSQQAGVFLNVIAYVAVGISAIGGIALVVGGIGVMNIMLVSVIERTREIGIRKAIGASRRDILFQFLMEAIAITLIGGMIGTALGVGAALAANSFITTAVAGQSASINWFSILATAVGFSVAIGLFFGTYPAARAAALSPIECLRHE
jgi:putative ABC transport system permease protein